METSPKLQERGNPTAPASGILPSPTSNSSSSSSSSSNSHSNGHQHHHPHSLHHHHYMPHPLPPPSPSTPTTPKQQQQQIHQTITRSEPNNPYPTTFVQADTSSFKQVVQMLTGSSETAKLASQSKPTTNPDHQSHHHHHHHHHQQPMSKNPIPPIKTASKLKPSKLYERRNSLKNLKINPLGPGFASNSGFSPRNAEILSPSMLDFPSLVLSPVTPLIPDPFNRSPSALHNGKPNNIINNNSGGGNNIVVNKAAEEKAIAEKGFYLHPSPASTPRESEPRLLPLFPVTSPRVSGSGSN